MPISISDYLKIAAKKFDDTGAFDAVLDVDSKLFIDPHLLKGIPVPELRGSYAKLEKRFQEILALLSQSTTDGDAMWRAADRRFTFPELRGTCIGYSSDGTDGSGMGPELRQRLLGTAKEIIHVGVTAPEIFELAGLFENDIGPDRISDMVGRIIVDDLRKYTQRILTSLGVPTTAIPGEPYQSVINPFNDHAVILVPRRILRDLPIAHSWEDIDIVCRHNAALRERVNSIIGGTWKKATRQKKEILRTVILAEPEVLDDLIDSYNTKAATEYDFDRDPSGEFVWKRASKEYTGNFPLSLVLPKKPAHADVVTVTKYICGKFRDLIENNGLSSLLYVEKGKPKHESAAQKLFYGIADSYCEANDLDLSAEANAGRGPCDFKISSGYSKRVVVETKLTSNKQLVHGFQKQIQEYGKAEKTKTLIYLVIDVDGASVTKVKELKELIDRERAKGASIPEVIYVDARSKKSASKV